MDDTARGRAWGVLFARLLLGLMFFGGALWRVFGIGPVGHARRFFVEPYADSVLPIWSLWMAGTAVPFVELIGGALVLLGLFRVAGLVAVGGVLVLVTVGHLLAEPLYAFNAHVFPRIVLVVFLLSVPAEWDRFSVDEWRRKPREARGES
jgi:uncharacterized membrane protein YphA (DoxX/SURF4 family)